MTPKRITRNERGPGVPMSFTMPATEIPELDQAVSRRGLTRASFMYRAVKNEMRRTLKRPARMDQPAAAG